MYNDTGDLGRLKHTTRDVCPDCRRGKLQVRVKENKAIFNDKRRGNAEYILDSSDYLYCPVCGFEGNIKTQGKQRRRVDVDVV